ncbi:uncharacterized protein [Musca autumnalis]|uniref:uncharacterized protein n=1 Tax=Musca autumnalis TaxID=221902 RepID=UPI003CF48503
MSENVSIKTEAFDNDYKQEDSNNDTNTLAYSTTKLEHFTNMGNDIEEDELDLDEMEEFLPENVDESTIDKIKEEDVDEMDDFLLEDSPSFYLPSSLIWKSDDGTKAFTHDEVAHQQVIQRHLTSTTTQQISLPKLEIMDVHEDEQNGNGPKVDHNEVDSGDVSMASNKIYGKYKIEDKICGYKNTTKSDMSRQHKCELCTSSYREFNNLQKHIRYKHPLSVNAEYTCGICDQKFTTQRGLKRHSVMMHAEAHSSQTRTKYKCELCDCSYVEDKALRAHIRHKHPLSIDSEYICQICHKRFTTQTGLNKHSYMMHPEARSTSMHTKHKCELCDSSFIEVKELRRHMRNKHPLSIDTEYICEICHKRFTTQIGLHLHCTMMHPEARSTPEAHSTQTRTKHKCELCDSSFTYVKDLRRHVRNKHPSSIDTNYICELCHKRFSTQVGLDVHCIKMH